MPDITFRIPDDVADRLIDGFVKAHGYEETIFNNESKTYEPNPVSKIQFLRKRILQWVRESAMQTEINTAVDLAKISAEDKASKDFKVLEWIRWIRRQK